MYMVMVKMLFGIDDTYDAEYSGTWHETKEAAQKELKEAEQLKNTDRNYIYAYIKED